MALRWTFNSFKSCFRRPSSFFRAQHLVSRSSSSASHLILEKNSENGVVTMTMQRPPVNSLDKDYMDLISQTVHDLEQDHCAGIIITSALPKVFCAGLELTELMTTDKEHLAIFWQSLQNLWLALYSTKLPVVAAINGHSIAGGCMIALTADTRIMVDGKFKNGLNEVILGLPMPTWLSDNAVNVLGHLHGSKAVIMGELYSPKEALEINLVDELCDSDQLLSRANERMAEWLTLPAQARSLTKSRVRRKTVRDMLAEREDDVKSVVRNISSDAFQSGLKLYMESLRKKKG